MKPRVITITFALVLILIIALPMAPYTPQAAQAGKDTSSFSLVVHPSFYTQELWERGYLVEDPTMEEFLTKMEQRIAELEARGILEPVPSKFKGGEKAVRAFILVPPNATRQDIESLKDYTSGIIGVFPTHAYTIVYAWVTKSDLARLSQAPIAIAALPETMVGYNAPPAKSDPLSRAQLRDEIIGMGFERKQPPAPAQAGSGAGGAPYHYTVELTGAAKVWRELGYMGARTTIAVIDTGVDYASPALGPSAVARDSLYGLPFILDDSLGIALTPATVTLTPVYDAQGNLVSVQGSIDVNQLYIYLPFFEYVRPISYGFVWTYGFVSFDVSQFEVPIEVYQAVQQGGAPPKFGLLFQIIFAPGFPWMTVPLLVADVDADGIYDSVYVDMSTIYYYLAQTYPGFLFPGVPDAPDHSFADEAPVSLFNPIAARDFDGDGFYDLSIGTLAGYVYDSLGVIIAEKTGVIEQSGGWYFPDASITLYGIEYAGAVWPGFDWWEGDYVVLHYDFFNHGTFVATTAAGRPVEAYVGFTPGSSTGTATIVGQAPAAKIASANALYAGSVLAALYFFSGFWPTTPYGYDYWIPAPLGGTNPWVGWTGTLMIWETFPELPRADLTNNSWGISGWAIWGWASGMDPISVAVDYMSFNSTTTHFIAAGNGGPGWGTTAVPGAATMAVTVGAATEFTYLAAFGALPGGNRQVVSWSNRGPAETGFPKPDVVAIGSFAWAVGRVWDSLAWGVMSGHPQYVVDLFGGTSQATPMAAGVAALVVDAAKAMRGYTAFNPSPLTPAELKVILTSTARDMGYDPFSQGGGFVDAYKAVKRVTGLNTTQPIAYLSGTDARSMYKAVMGVNPGTEFPMNSLVHIGRQGSSKTVTLVIEGKGYYRVKALAFKGERILERRTVYLDFGQIYPGDRVILAVYDLARFRGAGFVEFKVWFPFKYFDSWGRQQYGAPRLGWAWIHGVELWYWIDLNRNGTPDVPDEVTRIQYDIRGANMMHVQVTDLQGQVKEIEKLVGEYLGINPSSYPRKLLLVYRNFHNVWPFYVDSIRVPFKIEVRAYSAIFTPYVRTPSYVYVNGKASIRVTLIAPPGGLETGYVVVESASTGEKALVPFVTGAAAQLYRYPVSLPGARETGVYKDFVLRGAFDYTWRYESGDWRVFFFEVKDPTVKAVVVEVRWPVSSQGKDYTSNLDVQVYGPYTYYFADLAYYPSPMPVMIDRVYGLQLGGEISASFILFYDEPEPGRSLIVAQTPHTGLYRLVVRNIHYSGDYPEEPFTVRLYPIAVFTSPSPIVVPPGKTVSVRIDFMSNFSYKPLDVFMFGDAVFTPDGSNYYYVVDSLDAGLLQTIVNASFTANRAIISTKFSVDSSVPLGTTYIVPISVYSSVPVTSYGVIFFSGFEWELFKYNWIDVMLEVKTRR
ncbi:MAG: S8 family serine peptidase [Desulfurococcales archaeon]|nr:S8 family serine peptidase [Desulfurococcales archaeon]